VHPGKAKGAGEDDKWASQDLEFNRYLQCPISKFEKMLFLASKIYESF
jgi:hypothetical protein